MTHTLSIVEVDSAGSETVIQALGATLRKYALRPRTLAEVLENLELTTKEQAEFVYSAASAAALKTVVNALEIAFLKARRRADTKVGNRIFVKWQPDGAASAYRSEIVNGGVYLDEEAIDWQWANLKVDITIEWERLAFWEGAEAEVPLANGNGSGTGGRLVTNHDDATAGDDSYLSIVAANVAGVLPAACRLQILNSYNNSDGIQTIYAGYNYLSDPGTWIHVLEGEAANGGTLQANAAYSNSQYKQFTWSDTGEASLTYWDLVSGQLNAAKGRFFRILGRFLNYDTTADAVQFQLRIASSTKVLWTGPWVRGDASEPYLQVLGTIQIPPGMVGYSNLAGMRLYLYVRHDAAGAHTLDIDFIHLIPLDGWRRYRRVGSAHELEYNVTLIDDGLEDTFYELEGATKRKAFNSIGEQFMLQPGVDQYFYFLHYAGGSGAAAIARTMTVRLYYRPRFLTV